MGFKPSRQRGNGPLPTPKSETVRVIGRIHPSVKRGIHRAVEMGVIRDEQEFISLVVEQAYNEKLLPQMETGEFSRTLQVQRELDYQRKADLPDPDAYASDLIGKMSQRARISEAMAKEYVRNTETIILSSPDDWTLSILARLRSNGEWAKRSLIALAS